MRFYSKPASWEAWKLSAIWALSSQPDRWTGPHDPGRGTEWYRRAADRGHAEAQYNLGFMYLLGEGVPSDSAEGLRWLRLAADQGDVSSFLLLADLYRYGRYGVTLNNTQADQWDERYRQSERARAARQSADSR
jgi:TPR repeat protein